jgi:hypothetical protein
VFEFTLNVTYFHRISDIECMRSYLVYQTLNIIFSVVPLKNLRSIVHLCTIHSNTIPESTGTTLHIAFNVTYCLELHNAISYYQLCNLSQSKDVIVQTSNLTFVHNK